MYLSSPLLDAPRRAFVSLRVFLSLSRFCKVAARYPRVCVKNCLLQRLRRLLCEKAQPFRSPVGEMALRNEGVGVPLRKAAGLPHSGRLSRFARTNVFTQTLSRPRCQLRLEIGHTSPSACWIRPIRTKIRWLEDADGQPGMPAWGGSARSTLPCPGYSPVLEVESQAPNA